MAITEQLSDIISMSLEKGIHIHTHTNGDEATELVLDCMEAALLKHPSRDHRFTLQHCQLADRAQFRRMAKLGMCVNLFANHHFYWGDEHYKLTVGPERALRMNACATALENSVPMAIHSDAPITPLGPLFTAWCAVNRLTASGRTQGESEKIAVADALCAITLGAGQDGGSKTSSERATQIWKQTLADFKDPPTGGEAVIERLQPYIEKHTELGGAKPLD